MRGKCEHAGRIVDNGDEGGVAEAVREEEAEDFGDWVEFLRCHGAARPPRWCPWASKGFGTYVAAVADGA